MKAKGACLCGAVTLEANIDNGEVGVCHCATCRQWGGGPLLTVDCKDTLSVTGDDAVSTFSSSVWAERAFCKHCGSHLFYRLKSDNHYMVPVGILDIESSCILDHQIFIEEKPDYYSYAQPTKTMTGAEAFAMFGAEI